jgi:hypothetical protein
MSKIPHGLSQILATYGNPTKNAKLDPAWQRDNIVMVDLPYAMRASYTGANTVRKIQFHKLGAQELREILQEIYDFVRVQVKREVGFDLTTPEYDALTARRLREYGLDVFSGSFVYRVMRLSSKLSTHSWGIAIDFDSYRNGLGNHHHCIPMFAVEAFEKRGWVWGGRWKTPDAMHFQRCSGY